MANEGGQFPVILLLWSDRPGIKHAARPLSQDIDSHERIAGLVAELGDLQPRAAEVIFRYTDTIAKLDAGSSVAALKYEATYRVLVAFRDALIKLRLILEQNFKVIETLGLLAVTRYVFESLVWLRCLNQNPDYGLVFFRQALHKQQEHLDAQKKKLEDEVALFEELEVKDSLLFKEAMAGLAKDGTEDPNTRATRVTQTTAFIEAETDRRARRSFSLYAHDAKANGFGFQAYLLRTQGMRQVEDQIDALKSELDRFDSSCTPQVLKLARPRWNWAQQANSVGMQNQYDFLYGYTSRLLHATPASMFTNQKNLEPAEITIFLDFIYVSMLDALELAEGHIGAAPRSN